MTLLPLAHVLHALCVTPFKIGPTSVWVSHIGHDPGEAALRPQRLKVVEVVVQVMVTVLEERYG